jgi:polyphosphate kinase 2 (PPK2 family)
MLLSDLLKKKQIHSEDKELLKKEIRELQLQVLRLQQGLWHSKGRMIIALEGFDAAGKGGLIRQITEVLDPRSIQVHPIGPPSEDEQGRHYLYRFWKDLPPPGMIAIFDRTWYGRVLVEKVEKLITPEVVKRSYREINEFEKMLVNDGVLLVKIFLGVSRAEQLRRFEQRLNDPYKQWKLTQADLDARKKWNQYVSAVDEMLDRCQDAADWNLIPADHKHEARVQGLRVVTREGKKWIDWMENEAAKSGRKKSRFANQLR